MLQIKCRHLKALPAETCCFCNSSAPETLVDICLEYIANHLDTICEYEPFSENLKLKDSVTLPVEICERLLNVRMKKGGKINHGFINIFKDRHATGLKRVKLRNGDLRDIDLFVLLKHRLVELEITHAPQLTVNSLRHIIKYASNLTTLIIADSNNIFPSEIDNFFKDYNNSDFAITAPQLRKLCLKNFISKAAEFFAAFFKNLDNLQHLDLSNCSNLADLYFIQHLNNLTHLVLYNVDKIESMVPTICKLTNLRYLDISQSGDDRGKYEKANQLLAKIVESLPRLVSLDISGTNLAGRGVTEARTNEHVGACDIPGLSSRAKNPLQFLGLYETQHDACLRHDIPAKLVSVLFVLVRRGNTANDVIENNNNNKTFITEVFSEFLNKKSAIK